MHRANRQCTLGLGWALSAIITLTLPAGALAQPQPQPQPASGSPPTEFAERVRQQGQKIVAHAFGTLSSNLLSAINRGGVSNALEFCSVEALPLTASIADTNFISLRRRSHKARNPSNQADPADRLVLDQFQTALAAGKAPASIVQTNAGGGATYFAPIVINNPVCLNCHGRPGQEIQPEHQALLRRLYPQDQATGFKFGDLRGLWRVEFQPAVLTPSAQAPK